jgi:hypothetical protein
VLGTISRATFNKLRMYSSRVEDIAPFRSSDEEGEVEREAAIALKKAALAATIASVGHIFERVQ